MAKKDNKVQDDVRKQLEDLLLTGDQLDPKDAQLPIVNDSENGALPKAQHPSTQNMDYYKLKGEVEAESKKILKGVMEFYLDAKVIKESDYLKYKKRVDEMTLSNIIFTMRTCQHAIIKLLEDIDMGNLHPRIFEVLGQLQGQMMTIVKHQAAYVLTLEEGYKKVQDDHNQIKTQRMIEEENAKQSQDTMKKIEAGTSLKIRGTKALIEGIKNENKIEDANFEELKDETKRLTDPKNRPQNPTESGEIKPLSDDGFDIDEEMF